MSVRAAGGLLWRGPRAGGGSSTLEIALVHRPRHDDWSLPKGKLEPGEHPLVAACREVYEETGQRPVAGRRLPAQTYLVAPVAASPTDPTVSAHHTGMSRSDQAGHAGHAAEERRTPVAPGTTARSKTVEFWAMRASPDGIRPRDDEVDAVAWCTADAAARRLSYAGDREVVRAFLAVPAEVTTVLLVRHASAGRGTDWPGDDRVRPLDALGRAQAERLREALVWFDPRRVVSADLARCVQTVAPVAGALGLDVTADPSFDEDTFAAHPSVTLDRFGALVADGVATVVCSQGTVIPALVETLSRKDGVPVVTRRRAARSGPPPAPKGSTWALSFHEVRLVAADYYPDFAYPDFAAPAR